MIALCRVYTMSSATRKLFFIVLIAILGPAASIHATYKGSFRQHHVQTDAEVAYDAAKDYNSCYQIFSDEFGTTYNETCYARDKLNVCKERVKAYYPRVDDHLSWGMETELEFEATFWCTYPSVYFPVRALFHKYYRCPYVNPQFILLPEDYSVAQRMISLRALFADCLLQSVIVPELNKWHPNHKYSDPGDPVNEAFSSIVCGVHHYQRDRAKVVRKYCIVGDVYTELNEKLDHFAQAKDGLENWYPNVCPPKPEDPVEKVLKICKLEEWLNMQVNSSLEQCHRTNVIVRGAICIIQFQTKVPPYKDLHMFMPGFCKSIEQLTQCWKDVVQSCPKQSLASNMDLLIKLHQLSCAISLHDSSIVWDTIYKWASVFKKTDDAQIKLQSLYRVMYSITAKPTQDVILTFPFASTLNTTMATMPQTPPGLQRLLHQLASCLDRIWIYVASTVRFQGLNVLRELHEIQPGMAASISGALAANVELFLTMGGFIDYDPNNFSQWGL